MMIDREGDKLNTKYIVKAQRERSDIFQTLVDNEIDPNTLVLPNLEEIHRSGVKSGSELEAILEQLKGRVAASAPVPRQSFAQAVATPAPAAPVPQEQAVATPVPQQSGPISSPVMVAPKGATVPQGVIIPQPPTQGGE
jgi:hypothetical protein